MRNFIAAIIILSSLGATAQSAHENLGEAVNSKYSELHPYITPDGKKLFFVRSDAPQNSLHPDHTQDIWYSKWENGKWTPARHLGKPFNISYYNSIFYQSADGNTRIIRGAYKRGQFQGSGYSVTKMTKDGWDYPEQFKVKKFESMSKGKTSGMCIGADNKSMVHYLAASKDDIHDLYFSFMQRNGDWSQPKPLGPDINTSYDETTPFLAADGVTLYFSSDRPGGYGSCDVYMTRRLDSTWTKWSAPVNLGPSVNSEHWDAYFTIPASGDYAYMVSGTNTFGKSDIVRIRIKEESKPNPVVLISGKVLDAKTGQPIGANIEYNILPGGAEAGVASSNPGTGEYQIILPYGNFYGYKAQSAGYYSVSQNLDVKDLKEYKEITQDLYLAPVEVGQVVRLNNIFFESGKSILMEESFVELDNVVKFLNENPTMEIALAGHTDNVGSDDANLKLSDDRAKAVFDHLVSKGISVERLASKGYGEDQPVKTNDTEEGRQENRRVEFKIVKK